MDRYKLANKQMCPICKTKPADDLYGPEEKLKEFAINWKFDHGKWYHHHGLFHKPMYVECISV